MMFLDFEPTFFRYQISKIWVHLLAKKCYWGQIVDVTFLKSWSNHLTFTLKYLQNCGKIVFWGYMSLVVLVCGCLSM